MASDRLPVMPRPAGGYYTQGNTLTTHFDVFGNPERLDFVATDENETKRRGTFRPSDAFWKHLVAEGLVASRIVRLQPSAVKKG